MTTQVFNRFDLAHSTVGAGVVLEVGERSSELTVPGVLFDGLGISVWRETVLGSVTEGGPAYEGGLEPGDVLVSIASVRTLLFTDTLASVVVLSAMKRKNFSKH